METLLQRYLRNHGQQSTLMAMKELEKNYGIVAKQHPKYPALWQFKYDMIESPMGEPIVQECRGIVLDFDDDFKAVARPFDKFFNYGEGHAKPIDWSTAKVQEKVDGSLIIMYWYDGVWQIATSGTPDAGGEVNGCGFTFAELFWRVWEQDMGWRLPNNCQSMRNPESHYHAGMNKNITWMWELTTPYNRVVVQHKENRITLIGMRDRETGEEQAIEKYHSPRGFPQVVKSYPLQTIENIEATFRTMDPLCQEGYVVVDAAFNRVKVKNPAYVALHHIKDGFGPRRVLEIVRTNETSEFLTAFPEWEPMFNDLKVRYDALVKELEEAYAALKDIPVQKDFALQAVKTRYGSCLFALRAGKVKSVKEFLANVGIDHLQKALELK